MTITTTTAVEHGTTINAQPWPEGVVYVVLCLCGFVSPPYVHRYFAVSSGERHIANPELKRHDPVQCAPWCIYGDGHPNELYAEDQRCASDELRVDLSRHPLVEDAVLTEHGWLPDSDYVHVYALQRPGEVAEIDLSHAGGPEIRLTPAEARQLVEALQLVLGQIG